MTLKLFDLFLVLYALRVKKTLEIKNTGYYNNEKYLATLAIRGVISPKIADEIEKVLKI